MAGDDSQDDGERTRIGGLPPSVPKAPQAPAAPAAPTAPAAEDPGERTTIAPARPPGVPPAAPSAPSSTAPAPAAEEPGERTTIAPARPPGVPAAAAPAAPAAPGAAADTGEHTRVVATPPPGAARPPAAAAPNAASAAPQAASAAPPSDVTVDPARPRPAAAPDDDERTVVLAPRKVESTVRLERRAPRGVEETIQLDRPSLLLGRGHGCDVKLRTPTASREHAKILFRNGQWWIAGVEGKSFYADGARQTGGEVALVGGMRLRLGDDEFEVMDTTAGGAASRSGGGLWARLTAFVRGLFGRRA